MTGIALTLGQMFAATTAPLRTLRTPTLVPEPHFGKVGLNAKAVDLNEFPKYFYRYRIKYRFKVG